MVSYIFQTLTSTNIFALQRSDTEEMICFLKRLLCYIQIECKNHYY